MNIITAILLGIVQGLTEFIPVSSTAHLLIFQKILAVPADESSFSFTVIVQLGTILSLFVYFWKDIIKIVRSFFLKPFSTDENRLAWNIVFATVPALVAGYLLKDLVEKLFRTPFLEAGIRLLISGALLSLAELLGRKSRVLTSMKWLDAISIGLAQILSIFPGASRSGTTISAGLFLGFDRKSAARFAFLMSIPIMLAAGGYELLSIVRIPDFWTFVPILLIGFISSAVIGWVVIKWLIDYLGKHTLYMFAGYCAVAGLIALILYLLGI